MPLQIPTISATVGAARRVRFTLRDELGQPRTDYLDTDTLAASLWAGDDQASLFTPTVAWDDAEAGTLIYSHTAVQSALLTPGSTYTVMLSVTRSGTTAKTPLCRIAMVAAPGAATALTSYCTLDDMLRISGDLLSSLSEDTDQSGYAEQRHEALEWTHETVLSRARAILERQAEAHLPVVIVDPITISSGVDGGPGWGPSIYPDTSIETQMELIRGYLDDGLLLTDALEDRALVEANALYALYLVYDRQQSYGDKGEDTRYRKQAMEWKARARDKLLTWVARIDRDDDGEVILRIGA